MKIEWIEQKKKYGPNIYYAKMGKIVLGSCSYSMRSRTDPETYTYRVLLPGLKKEYTIGKQNTLDEAKVQFEVVVNKWFEYLK